MRHPCTIQSFMFGEGCLVLSCSTAHAQWQRRPSAAQAVAVMHLVSGVHKHRSQRLLNAWTVMGCAACNGWAKTSAAVAAGLLPPPRVAMPGGRRRRGISAAGSAGPRFSSQPQVLMATAAL